jgi:4-aminobutyrate aminotransferase-like enzyme
MARKTSNPLRSLLDAPKVRDAARALIEAVHEEARERELSPKAYERALRDLGRLRGRPLFNPSLASHVGRGARVRLTNGHTLIDFASGIGVYGFGHSDPDLLEAAVVAAAGDTVFQGHLLPGPEYLTLSKALMRHAGPRLKHVWLSVTGAGANENALKMIYQRRAPADRIVAFERAFAGRTLAMADITDKPAYREGLPVPGNTLYIPFYDEKDPESTQKSVAALDAHLTRYPGRIAGMLFELIQGEGGYHTAPADFFRALMVRCQQSQVAVWVDEVQTYARTGELFAFRTLELEEWVDVVTAGKSLQGSAVLFTKEYNPKPGLVAGTFAGSTVGMAVGTRIIERLEDDGYLGSEGRVAVLSRRFERRLDTLRKRMPRAIGEASGMGAMQAFVPFDGSAEIVSALLKAAFEQGLLVHSAGKDPMKLRFLLPVNTTDEELEAGFTMLEKAITRVAEDHDLAC